MIFGEALEALNAGKKVARQAWGNMGTANAWIVLMPPLSLPPHSSQEPGPKVNERTARFIGEDTPLDSQPYFASLDAQGKWNPGWIPTQADILGEDWVIVS